MSINTFGKIFRFTTFGESHGPSIGCVIDGVPPGMHLSETDIQLHLNKRRPGQNKYTTQRKETDAVKILSGIFEGITTGAPIGLDIKNEDTRSKDYEKIKDQFRPGHADFTYYQKYGVRDYRGGGRSSARETALRVAAGAVARKILGEKVKIRGALVKMGNDTIDRANWSWEEIEKNPFFSPDPKAVPKFESLMKKTRKKGSSIGAIIEIVASGIPPGLGAPIYGKLDADLAGALMGIPAVKGVEIGAGFNAAELTGEENADEMHMEKKSIKFLSNNAGGVLGGISTGQDIVIRFAVKPTSSILTPKRTINTAGKDVEIRTIGRHDPCVGIRAVPIGEAMVACVLADHYLLNRAQCG